MPKPLNSHGQKMNSLKKFFRIFFNLEKLEQEKRQAELEQKCQFVWNYVRGMLSNLQKMKFERLESMLKMLGQCNPGLKIDSEGLKFFLLGFPE